MIRNILTAWRKRRQHQRVMSRFFALFEQESVALRECMIGLAEIYADAQRRANEQTTQPEEASR